MLRIQTIAIRIRIRFFILLPLRIRIRILRYKVQELSPILPVHHRRCCWGHIFELTEIVFVRSSKKLVFYNQNLSQLHSSHSHAHKWGRAGIFKHIDPMWTSMVRSGSKDCVDNIRRKGDMSSSQDDTRKTGADSDYEDTSVLQLEFLQINIGVFLWRGRLSIYSLSGSHLDRVVGDLHRAARYYQVGVTYRLHLGHYCLFLPPSLSSNERDCWKRFGGLFWPVWMGLGFKRSPGCFTIIYFLHIQYLDLYEYYIFRPD